MERIVVVGVAMIFLFGGSVGAADKIRIGVPQQVVHWMVFPLAKKGLLKGGGVRRRDRPYHGPSGRSALVSGEIDYTTIAFIVNR
jgi:hypothetical protein